MAYNVSAYLKLR